MFGNARPLGASAGYGISVEHDGLGAAMYESWCEYHDIRGRAEVAMVGAYENYIMNTSQTEEQKVALFEGVVGDIWEKIKAFFKKIAEKIKSWWNAAVKFFQSHFQSDEEFLKKYKDEITAKDISKFTCSMYPWPKMTGGLGSLKEIASGVQKSIDAGEKYFKDISESKEVNKENISDKIKEAKKIIDSESYKAAKESAPVDAKGGMGKFKTALTESYRGKSKKEKKGLSGLLSVSTMISIIEDGKDVISDLKEAADTVAEAADGFADKVDAAVKARPGGDEGEAKGENTRIVNGAVEVAKYSLSYATAELEVMKSLASECMSECRSVLGAILRYSEPSKESSGYTWGANNKTSLMDAFSAGF